MKTIIKLVLIYIGFQFIGGLLALPVMFFLDKTYMLAFVLILASLMMIWYLFKKDYIRMNEYTWSIRSVSVLSWMVAYGLGAYFLATWLNEQVDLPNVMEDQFMDLSFNPLGVLGIVVLGPVAEELLFRGAILGFLLKKLSWRNAILTSALIFGIIHMNPAQILYAFLLGMALGRIYYKTGSLLICMIIHVMLNGISTALTICYPDAQSLGEMSGVAPEGWFLLVGALLLIGGSYYLNRMRELPFWKDPVLAEETASVESINEESKE